MDKRHGVGIGAATELCALHLVVPLLGEPHGRSGEGNGQIKAQDQRRSPGIREDLGLGALSRGGSTVRILASSQSPDAQPWSNSGPLPSRGCGLRGNL